MKQILINILNYFIHMSGKTSCACPWYEWPKLKTSLSYISLLFQRIRSFFL